MTIQEAKDFLESKGYFVKNLWCVDDVYSKFECSEEEAHKVLEEALTSDSTFDTIWFNIDYFGNEFNLKNLDDNSNRL